MKNLALALATIAALGFSAPAFAGGEPAPKRAQVTEQGTKKAVKKTTKRKVGPNIHAGSQRRPVRKDAPKNRSSLNLKSADANAFVAGYEPRRKPAKRATVAKRIKNAKVVKAAKRAAKTSLAKTASLKRFGAVKPKRKSMRQG